MASYKQLEQALINADLAKDTQAAKTLAQALKEKRGDRKIGDIPYVSDAAYYVVDSILGLDDGVDTLAERLTKPIGEAGEGLVSGVIGIGEGIGTLASIIPDFAAGTDVGNLITKSADKMRDVLGIDPEGIAGKGTEFVTQYLAPLGAAAKIGLIGRSVTQTVDDVAKLATKKPVKKLSKGERLGNYVKDGMWFAGIETAVADDDANTIIGDWIGFDPFKTSDLVGQTGRDAAIARAGNKLKLFIEANAIGGAVDGLIRSGSIGAKALAETDKGKSVSKRISDNLNLAGSKIDELLKKRMTEPDELNSFQKIGAGLAASIRPSGFLPSQLAEQRFRIDSNIQADIFEATIIDRQIREAAKKAVDNLPDNLSHLSEAHYLNKLDDYMKEVDPDVKKELLSSLPKEMQANAVRMRKGIDRLTDKILNGNFVRQYGSMIKPDGKLSLAEILEKNKGSYVRRSYKAHNDKKYVPTQKTLDDADTYFKGNKNLVEKEISEAISKDPDRIPTAFSQEILNKYNASITRNPNGTFKFKFQGDTVPTELAQYARKMFLDRHSIKDRPFSKGMPGIQRVARDKLNTGIFVERENLGKTLRALLGEDTDGLSNYLKTVSDLAQFKAVDDFFGEMAELSKAPYFKNMFISPNRITNPAMERELLDKGYVRLGSKDAPSIAQSPTMSDEMFKDLSKEGWGQLNGFYVPKDIYNDLTRYIASDDDVLSQGIRYLLNSFLRAKALSQYSKTILSPITQIRNLITASLFAAANGNLALFGRGSDYLDSFRVVYADIMKQGDAAILKDLQEARRLGLVGTQTELREIQDSLRRGILSTENELSNQSGLDAILGKERADFLRDFRPTKAALKGTKFAEDIYQASDDGWKYFSFKSEQAKLKYALDGLSNREKIGYLLYNKKVSDIGPDTVVGKGIDLTRLQRKFEKDLQLNPNLSREQAGTAFEILADDAVRIPGLLDELIKERAAQIVRDTVPNYNKAASKLVTTLRRSPFGNFVVFPMEIYRTSFNIIRQAADEMSSGIESIQKRGRQRMLSFIGTTMGIGAGIQELAYQLTCVSREEMDAYQRVAAAPWERGAVLVPLGRDKDGKITYFNFSTSNPYDTMNRAARRFMREFDTSEKNKDSVNKAMFNTFRGAITEFIEPFLSEAMVTEAMVDVLIRGRTKTGARIYEPGDVDTVGEKISKSIAHVFNVVLPNISPVELEKVGLPGFGGFEVKPKKIIRATLGNVIPDIISPEDKLGREYSPARVLASIVGVSPLEIDPKKIFEFKSFQMANNQRGAKKTFTRVVDDANVNSQQLLEKFVEANGKKLRLDKQSFRIIQDFKKLGLSERDIRKIFKQENIGGLKSVLRGRFEPFKISKDNIQNLRRNDKLNILPRAAINEVRKKLRNLSLN